MSSIGRNMFWLLLSQVSTWGISVMMLIVIPRLISDVDFGRVEFAFTFVSFFALAAMAGTGTFITKSIARDASLLGPYVANTFLLKLIGVPVLAVAAVVVGAVWGLSGQSVLLVAICSLTMLTGALNDAIVAGLHGRQRMKGAAAFAAIQQYVSAIGSLVVLVVTDSIVLYTLALVGAGLIPLLANLSRIWPEIRGNLGIDVRLWGALVRGGLPFLVWSAVQLVYGKIDILMIRGMVGEAPVAWYALAWQWVSMPVFFATIVSTAFFPALSEHGAGTGTVSAVFVKLANQSVRLVVFVGLPAAAGIALVAHDVFDLLGYTGGYLKAVPLMQVLALSIPIVGMDVMLGNALMAADRQRQWVMVGIAACFLNIGLNVPAIHLTDRWYGNGAIGAAVATVITEIMMMVGAIYLRPQGVLDRATLSFLGRALASTLVMVPVVWLLADAWFVLRVAAGLLAYAGASIALRTFSPRHWRRDFLPGRDAYEPAAGSVAVQP